MSGHSKWHKIKHQKAAKDPKRSKEFARLSRAIMVAAREGDPNPDNNPSLRKAIDDAKSANVPKENIQKAIDRGSGTGDGASLEDMQLEGYGPGGVAVMIEAQTDNRNRTVSEIRHLFKIKEGSLGEPGSAAYVFGTDPENPQFRTPIPDPDQLGQFKSLVEELESNDDVLSIWHNLEE